MNETTANLTYEAVTKVTHHPAIAVLIISILLIPLFIYLLIGLKSAKTTSGKTVYGSNGKPKRMIQTGNFWIVFTMWLVVQGGLILLLFFPFWLRI